MEYTKALETVEKWLDKKHIRLFCRIACNGRCCYPQCDENHRCQRPPLLCAMYLCDDIRKIIFGFHSGEKYIEITQKINKIVTKAGYDTIQMKDTYPSIEIPDDLITALLSTEYQSDIHYAPIK